MKPTTENIYTILNDANFWNKFDSLLKANPGFEYEEITLQEAYNKIRKLDDIIISAIRQNAFDTVSGKHRTAIATHLENINDYLNTTHSDDFNFNIRSVISSSRQIIAIIDELADTINIAGLPISITDFEKYQKDISSFSEIKDKYHKQVLAIEKSEKINEDSNIIFENISQNNSKSNELLQEIINSNKQSTKELSESFNNSKRITETLDVVKKHEEDIEARKLKINTFHTNIEEYEKQISDNTERLNKYVADSMQKIAKSIGESNAKTTLIVDTNTNLQEQIKTLLQGATAGKLYEAFQIRKGHLEQDLNVWLLGIISTALGAVGLAILYLKMGDFAWDGRLVFKVLTALPFIGLEYFFVSEYTKRKELIEQYAFKAAISLSFIAYREMMDTESKRGDEKSLEFIIETVRKIYEPPFSKDDFKKSLSDKYLEFADKHTDKMLDIVGKQIDKVKPKE